MVRRVGSVRQRNGACFASCGAHLPAALARSQQAHLREVVETVFVEDDHPRLVPIEHGGKFALGIFKHGVEHGDTKSVLARYRGSVESSQWGVRLRPLQLLRIVGQMICVSEQNVDRTWRWGAWCH